MGFFSVFSAGRLTEKERVTRAESFIREVQDKARQAPSKALRMLKKGAQKHEKALGMGGAAHDLFRELALELLTADSGISASTLPTVEVVRWSVWQNPELKDLQMKVAEMDSDILYCKADNSEGGANPVVEMEALLLFAVEPELAMTVTNEENMLFRKSFILKAAEALNPHIEEIGQELNDYAADIGAKVLFL